MNVSTESRQALIASLRRELDHFEAGYPVKDEQPISTGVAALDRLLPAQGLKRGTLVEYLAPSPGCGAGTLALSAAREACGQARALVVVELHEPGTSRPSAAYFYPPAAAAWGVDLSRLLVLRPASEADALWALDQSLRCPGVGAVWVQWDKFDTRDFRRLQLAAECGGTLGLLIRPARQRGQPSWADVQWEVWARRGWLIEVELVRCRGAAGSRAVLLGLDETAGTWREVTNEAAHSMSLPAGLADSTGARRA